MASPTLRSRQIDCLKRMLNLNEPVTKSSLAEPVWKVLVYDRFGQDIISPLLNVKELRELGVTLHLQLHSDRDQISDVPAVYFVQPTDDNIQRICQDFSSGLYEKYYLNFISPISRHRLEDLATAALQFNQVELVTKVVDQYLNYISLEDDLFTVKHHNREDISYYALNGADSKDTDIEHIRDVLVDSIFSLLVTLGTVPIIRCPKGNAAEMVAEALDKKLRENLRDTRNSLFTSDIQSGNFSFQRPVLIILDRNMDLCTPLHHTWTYQALCHDVFDLQLNRVTVSEPLPRVESMTAEARAPHQPAVKKYDLAASDKFWREHKASPFPTVAESIQKEVDEYRSSEEEVKKLKTVMGFENGEDESMSNLWSDNTSKLTSAVSSLPELLEKKRVIDLHMNIATAMLEHIKSRKLDVYFETEEKIMSKSSIEKSVMEIIQDPEAGTPEDKMRLFIIYFISTPTVSTVEYEGFLEALQTAGCDTSAMSYIKNYKAFAKVTSGPIQTGTGQSTYSAMFNRIMSTGSQLYMEGVKSLVVGTKNLPVTRIVDAVMENKSIQETEEYCYFDPKMIRGSDMPASQKNKSNFQEAIVFMVGGGNYIEYINLINYEKRQTSSTKKIIYGCSELQNASQFMKQLTRLGQS